LRREKIKNLNHKILPENNEILHFADAPFRMTGQRMEKGKQVGGLFRPPVSFLL